MCDVTVSTAIFYIQSMAYLRPFCEEKGELVEFTHCRRGGFWLRVDSFCLARNSCSKNRCREMGRKRPCFPLRVGVPIMMWHHVKTMNTRLNLKKHTHTHTEKRFCCTATEKGPTTARNSLPCCKSKWNDNYSHRNCSSVGNKEEHGYGWKKGLF